MYSKHRLSLALVGLTIGSFIIVFNQLSHLDHIMEPSFDIIGLDKDKSRVEDTYLSTLKRGNSKGLMKPDMSSSDLLLNDLKDEGRRILAMKEQPLPPETLGAFIHIGKTGGSNLSAQLINGCHSFRDKPCYDPAHYYTFKKNLEAALSKLTTYYHIPDFANALLFQNIQAQKHKFLVFSVRDPLERIISIFTFTHPENQVVHKFYVDFAPMKQYKILLNKLGSRDEVYKFREKKFKENPDNKRLFQVFSCFPTLEKFANLLANYNDYKEESWDKSYKRKDCSNLAKTIFRGSDSLADILPHFYWGYKTLLRKLEFNTLPLTTLAIRTSHMDNDWESVNRHVGDDRKAIPLFKSHIRESKHFDYPIQKDISEAGKEKLCLALRTEYKAYFQILNNSVNLSEEDRKESISISRDNCGKWLDI